MVGGLPSVLGGVIDADMNTEPNRTQPNRPEPFRSLLFIFGTKFTQGVPPEKM